MYATQRLVTFIVILSLLRYINNPNGVSILALLRNTPPSHVDGLRNLLANYLNTSPTPMLSSQFSKTTRLSICFNLPFFVVTTRDYEDSRILTGDRYLRARYDFSLLCLETLAPLAIQKGSPVFCSGAILHQAVYSLLVTGHNSNYWVAVCLDEDFSGKELRLAHGNKGENNHLHEDPITAEPCLKVTQSPQAYSLMALTRQLEKIVKHHGQILECLRESLTIHASISNGGFAEAPPHQRMRDWRKCFPKVLQRTIDYNSRLVDKVESFLADPIIDPETTLYGELQ
ncbi:hypothetical protein BFJ69_g12333 [Fusarium oxysporum]|uniref:Uncharacterized protein n=1 Tax=Fusarium oxysporum TaxID=5507 RepID=A0A420MPJ0_FUSOX|nr:hypothetical protein BFJ69_g12333 [Fusarium oxysporum]